MAQRSRLQAAAAAEIGPLPAVRDPARRQACAGDLAAFARQYYADACSWPLSADHVRLLARIQTVIQEGGRLVNAVFRGAGKTTLAECATLWALLYGRRRYVAVFSADRRAAEKFLQSLKLSLELNERLAEDFPEAVLPVRALEGKPQRCASQTHQGRLTHIEWRSDRIVLAAIPGAPCAGAIVTCHGLLSGHRGMRHRAPDGRILRPDLVILDDPQTDASARSPLQTENRLRVIERAILRAGGHGSTQAVVLNGTVIAPGDLVDRLLERKGRWQAERVPMLKSMSEAHERLWLGEYARLRADYDPDDPAGQAAAWARATEFYRQHREEMDRGAVATWPDCYDRAHEISAVQHAYNILIDDGPDVFAAECQCRPLRPDPGQLEVAQSELVRRISGHARGEVPTGCEYLTAYVDVHDRLLYWAVWGFTRQLGGQLVDYGTEPEQGEEMFVLATAQRTLGRKYRGGREAAISAGLIELLSRLLERCFRRSDGIELQVHKVLVDAGYLREAVFGVVRRLRQGDRVMAAVGHGIRAGDRPMADWQRKPGEQPGWHWRIEPARSARGLRVVRIDTNYWKTLLRDRLALPVGDPAAAVFFGQAGTEHRLLAEHLTAEYPTETEGRGRKVIEWRHGPDRRDNHWLDCSVGCFVAASMLGAGLPGAGIPGNSRRRRRVRYLG